MTPQVQATRVSYGMGTKSVNDDAGLINYLMRHRHTSLFEMVEIKLLASMPMYVAREMEALKHMFAGETLEDACTAAGLKLLRNDGQRMSSGEGVEFVEKVQDFLDKQ